MKKRYIVDINGVDTVIEETLPDRGQATWEIIRPATVFDRDIPRHWYFKGGMIPA